MITKDELRVLRDKFDLKRQEPEEQSHYREREKLQREFVSKFPPSRIPHLSLDDYVEGKGSKDSFCYWVEVQTTKLGQIKGSNASKFGVFFDKETEHYKFTEKFKSFKTESAAFIFLRDEIVRLIKAGSTKNLDVIREIDISPMFKGKILALYHPEKYLNIFSETYVDYFSGEIGLSVPNGGTDVLDKRALLFAFKSNDEIMSKWTMYEYTNFLYEACGSPKKSSKIPEAPRKYVDAENFPPARKTGGDSGEVDMDDLFNNKPFENATVFEFGYIAEPQQFEVRQIRFHIVSPKGQGEFEAATFIKRGKRKGETVKLKQVVVIQGWGHPKLDKNTTHTVDGKAKFPFGSNSWNDLLDQHLASLVPPFQLIVDGRKRLQLTHNAARGFPINELGDSTQIADIEQIKSSKRDPTTKLALVEARQGQGKFGSEVREFWNYRCSVTGASTKAALEASHIKRWADSDDT